ncbi:MAG: cell division protein FtsQ/DivIB [Chakrabartia sp.]
MTVTSRPSRAPAKRPVTRGAQRPQPSVWQQFNELFWDYMPFKAETIERALTYLTIFAILGGLAAAAITAGIPQAIGTELGQMAGRAGFTVKSVDVQGLKRMDRDVVFAVALDQQSIAMPLVDLEKVRQQLLQYGWIGDARISRHWPNTLVVRIIERKPAAVWQHNQRLTLIDATGVKLEMVDPRAVPELPLIIGPNANQRAEDLFALLNAAPAIKPHLAVATWVGNRRWDIRFDSGETLMLPEGDRESRKALLDFARIEREQRLLGNGFVSFDIRDPTKFVLRRGRAPGATPDAPVSPEGEAAPTNETTTDAGTPPKDPPVKEAQ